MTFSPVGKKKFAAQVALFLINVLVLAFAIRVNRFQEFFYVADFFPFALSIVTLVLLFTIVSLDIAIDNAYTARPQFEAGILGALSIFWLAFNAFSTSRWRFIPTNCGSIPAEFAEERTWCKDVQALKALVWIEFLICFATAVSILRYALIQNARGYKHVFKMPLSRFRPELRTAEKANYSRDSEFLQFEKVSD